MKILTFLFPLFSYFAALFVWLSASHAQTTYQVGASKVDVTPDYPIRLNGFGFRRQESEGVTQRIWAKVISIKSGDAPRVVLATLDSLGVRKEMVEQVAARLKTKVGLPPECFALTFTHSHTTPKVNGASNNIFSQPIPKEHQEHLIIKSLRHQDNIPDFRCIN